MGEAQLKVKLFGPFEVWRDEQPIPPEAWPQRKTQLLLKLLLLERGRLFTLDQLIEYLYSEDDPQKAARSLRARISELRHVLEPKLRRGADSRFVLGVRSEGYSFSAEASCWIDTEEFRKRQETAQAAEEAGRWTDALHGYEQVVTLHRGDYLADDPYEEWTIAPRERWREQYLSALAKLAECYARFRQFPRALQCCRQALEIQPWSESVYRQMMLYHYHAGEHQKAVQAYQACVQALQAHLELEPSSEMQELHRQILRREAPPLPQVFPNNLPQALASFIGRERERAEVKQLLKTNRLLTFTGVGGCGKTRLALQIAAELLEEYPDGVWWVDLAPLGEAALVPQRVLSVLGLKEEPDRAILETLADHLRLKKAMLVLDNCEHLLSACAPLAQGLLQSCPQLQILATSREILGLMGEVAWVVPTLSLPDHLPSPERLMQYDAAHLFVERATLRNPKFAVTTQNAAAVAQVCHRLDGIPLALELAAARLKVLSVEQLVQRLDDRFCLLISASRTALPRHQTLQATMDWSFNLLSHAEQCLLCCLSVFAGGFTLEAAEGICAGEAAKAHEALDLLTRLVDRSLVMVAKQSEPVRYTLLETIRQYSWDKLQELGERQSIRDRHLAFFLKLAEDAEPKLLGAEQTTWLDRLEEEHDNLRAALGWSIESDAEAGLRLGRALRLFWRVRGHLSEGREWLERALSRGHPAPATARVRALNAAGNLAWAQSDYDRARELLEESLALCRALGDKRHLVEPLHVLGFIAYYQDDYHRASGLLEESLSLCRNLRDEANTFHSLNILGRVRWRQGDYKQAVKLGEESLALARKLGNPENTASALNLLGLVTWCQGDHEKAAMLLEESLSLSRELGDKEDIADTGFALALVVRNRGDYGRARSLLEESLALSRELDYKQGIALSLYGLGRISYDQGDDRLAAARLGDSLAWFWKLEAKWFTARCLESIAIMACGQRRPKRAARLFGAAEALRDSISAPLPPCETNDYQRNVAAVSVQLSGTRFESAWAQGRAMTLDQAVEYALKCP